MEEWTDEESLLFLNLNFKHLFFFGTSHKSACLLLLPDQRSFGLIRHRLTSYNRLFDPNCNNAGVNYPEGAV